MLHGDSHISNGLFVVPSALVGFAQRARRAFRRLVAALGQVRFHSPFSNSSCRSFASLHEGCRQAKALWESIEAGLADTDEDSAVRESIRRDEELSSGAVAGRTHEEVMEAAQLRLQ